MKLNKEVALKTAEFLLQIKAIKLNNSNPFTWASGWKSPIYCDNRKTLSYPKIRNNIRQELVNIINEEFGDIDVIAGVATAGIPHGVLIAQDLGKPFVYVRSSSKAHGLENKIEGVVNSGQSVVVVEDLVSTGGSSLNAVKALEEAGCKVKGMVAIFTYGFKTAEDNFKKAKCKLFTLSNYEILIKQALETGYIKESDISSLSKWREDPANWGK
ncbi:MAG: orotate phosphoribosyltransferase [Saprospiraceae bacterium]|nr:orotate phosphoribosyltransferase [Saprospiraceae bacterium]